MDTEPHMKRQPTKILLIDDDKTVVTVITAVLRAANYQVVSALDPVQGFMAFRREKPQLVVLDLMMPAGGGMQLLEKLTSMGKAPVIVITATQQGNAEAQARAAGAAGFLTKPVDPAALKQLIEELEASE
jgi:CheY-like chemotaxis protein